MASSRQCVYIKRKVSDRFAERIAGLKIPGIRFEEESRRNYPNGTLFAHIIGFTGVDNNGLEGLELRFNRNLAGRDGFQEINRNALYSMCAFVKTSGNFRPQEDGSDVVICEGEAAPVARPWPADAKQIFFDKYDWNLDTEKRYTHLVVITPKKWLVWR